MEVSEQSLVGAVAVRRGWPWVGPVDGPAWV